MKQHAEAECGLDQKEAHGTTSIFFNGNTGCYAGEGSSIYVPDFGSHSTTGEPPVTVKPSLLEDQLVDMAFITHFTGLTDKWFYKQIKDGLFPKPIKLGRSSRWLQSEVEAWVEVRILKSRSHK